MLMLGQCNCAFDHRQISDERVESNVERVLDWVRWSAMLAELHSAGDLHEHLPFLHPVCHPADFLLLSRYRYFAAAAAAAVTHVLVEHEHGCVVQQSDGCGGCVK